jgi:hypothetical protein
MVSSVGVLNPRPLSRDRSALTTIPGVPNLGDASPWGYARGSRSVISWVHLFQWGDAIDVRGDAEAKRLGNPDLESRNLN